MSANKPLGSVGINLTNFINTTPKKGVDYEIAKIILNNIKDVKDISITELSELCFVSTATLSRFFKHMGYENFQEFKKAASIRFRIENDYSDELKYEAKNNPNESLKYYTESIMKNIQHTLEENDVKKIDAVAELIHDSNRVGVFGSQIFKVLQCFYSIR